MGRGESSSVATQGGGDEEVALRDGEQAFRSDAARQRLQIARSLARPPVLEDEDERGALQSDEEQALAIIGADLDTLRLIKNYRGVRDGKEIDFGVAAEVIEPGAVRIGDAVEPLARI